LAEGTFGPGHGSGSRASAVGTRSIARRVGDALDPPRKAIGAARWTIARLGGQASSVEQRRRRGEAVGERARAGADEQVRRTLELEHADARENAQGAPRLQQALSDKRAQLQRVRQARAGALARGDLRHAARLGHRGQRIEGEIELGEAQLTGARRAADEGERAQRRTGTPYTREQMKERERFLDAQAALPAVSTGGRSSTGGFTAQRRDYAALAALAGYSREQYDRLDPGDRRAARLEIDRELALRRELGETARNVAADQATAPLGRRERRRADRELDSALAQRMLDDGRAMPRSRLQRTAVDRWREAGRGESGPGTGAQQSSVMRDAREVAARLKRQLGRDRP
jgi:hypothetical protein